MPHPRVPVRRPSPGHGRLNLRPSWPKKLQGVGRSGRLCGFQGAGQVLSHLGVATGRLLHYYRKGRGREARGRKSRKNRDFQARRHAQLACYLPSCRRLFGSTPATWIHTKLKMTRQMESSLPRDRQPRCSNRLRPVAKATWRPQWAGRHRRPRPKWSARQGTRGTPNGRRTPGWFFTRVKT